MIGRLFGETEAEQFAYLQPRLLALGVGVGVLMIGALLAWIGVEFGNTIGGLGAGICVIVLLIFGWAIVRGLLGVSSVWALFSYNVVIGVVIFILFIMIGYFGGIIVAFIGVCRYLTLLKIKKAND